MIKAIIVDDEPKMGELLHEILNDLYPNIIVDNPYNNWKDAIKGVHNTQPDIIFMDISMPEKSGFDILNLLPESDAEIIFVTAHSEFAIEAFEHAAAGYILKPVNEKKLVDTVNRVLKKIDKKQSYEQTSLTTKIGIPDNDSIVYHNLSDIYYLETVNRYTKVVTKDSEIVSSYSLGTYKKILQNTDFLLVHRSFMVNLNHVVRLDTNNFIVLSNGKEIPISKNSKTEFLNKLQKVGK